MTILDFFVLFAMVLSVIYLVLRLRSGRKKPPQQRIIRYDRKSQAPQETPGESRPAGARNISPEIKAQPVELPSAAGWRPMTRSQVEVETVWRLEHVLRDLPDLGETPLIEINYDMEPREIAMFVVSNPFYAAKILKTVNSAAFGLRYHIDSLQRAITYLGYNEVKNIIFQHVIRSGLSKSKAESEYFDLLGFWKHSHAVSVCAEYILREVLRYTRNVGAITTAALLHDIGWVLYSHYDQETAAGLFGRLKGQPRPENPMQLEEEAFGFNHLIAGKMLAEQWKIHREICELVGLHHCGTFGFDEALGRETAFGACIVAKAENLAHENGFPNPLCEPRELAIDLSGVLGQKVGEMQVVSIKLREKLDKTMKFIEEFDKSDNVA